MEIQNNLILISIDELFTAYSYAGALDNTDVNAVVYMFDDRYKALGLHEEDINVDTRIPIIDVPFRREYADVITDALIHSRQKAEDIQAKDNAENQRDQRIAAMLSRRQGFIDRTIVRLDDWRKPKS